jgi:acetate kinase
MGEGPRMNVLSLNLGSSSLKYSVHAVDGGAAECRLARNLATSSRPGDAARTARQAVADVLEHTGTIDAVGHRVVFGGERDMPQQVTAELIELLEDLKTLDPLHAPGALAVMHQAMTSLPDAEQIACFDTAFFHDMPRLARALPLPSDDALVRRYGFHGLSYEHICRVLGARLPPRTIVAHLGNGASAAALENGRPIASTMGFSPLGGMIMSTRPGDVDPGALLYLLERSDVNKERLREILENRSGLRALSGGESDLRVLCGRSDDAAVFAVEMFVRSAARAMAALAAELGGLDMLVFTGGVGAHNPDVRARITGRLAFLNPNAAVEVVESDENASIAHNVARVLSVQQKTG